MLCCGELSNLLSYPLPHLARDTLTLLLILEHAKLNPSSGIPLDEPPLLPRAETHYSKFLTVLIPNFTKVSLLISSP